MTFHLPAAGCQNDLPVRQPDCRRHRDKKRSLLLAAGIRFRSAGAICLKDWRFSRRSPEKTIQEIFLHRLSPDHRAGNRAIVQLFVTPGPAPAGRGAIRSGWCISSQIFPFSGVKTQLAFAGPSCVSGHGIVQGNATSPSQPDFSTRNRHILADFWRRNHRNCGNRNPKQPPLKTSDRNFCDSGRKRGKKRVNGGGNGPGWGEPGDRGICQEGPGLLYGGSRAYRDRDLLIGLVQSAFISPGHILE